MLWWLGGTGKGEICTYVYTDTFFRGRPALWCAEAAGVAEGLQIRAALLSDSNVAPPPLRSSRLHQGAFAHQYSDAHRRRSREPRMVYRLVGSPLPLLTHRAQSSKIRNGRPAPAAGNLCVSQEKTRETDDFQTQNRNGAGIFPAKRHPVRGNAPTFCKNSCLRLYRSGITWCLGVNG